MSNFIESLLYLHFRFSMWLKNLFNQEKKVVRKKVVKKASSTTTTKKRTRKPKVVEKQPEQIN